jgi:alpha-amylase
VAAPDLDHANPELRAGLTDWLTWLQQDVGFEGWRFDYSRG